MIAGARAGRRAGVPEPHGGSTTSLRERRGDVRRVVAELDVRGEFDEHASMCLRQAVDDPAGLTTRIVIDLRDLTGLDRRGLQLLNEAIDDTRARETSLTLLLCGGDTQAAIVDAVVSAGLRVELTTGTPSATPHAGHHGSAASRGRMFGEHGGAARWRSRVLALALRARDLLADGHRNSPAAIVDNGSDGKVRQRLYGAPTSRVTTTRDDQPDPGDASWRKRPRAKQGRP
jgi:anti-anti-sigma regulatory factor